MQWYDGLTVQWLNGDDNKDEDEDEDVFDDLVFDTTTNLVFRCIPVREGRGVFSKMISTKTVRTRMTINYNDNNE